MFQPRRTPAASRWQEQPRTPLTAGCLDTPVRWSTADWSIAVSTRRFRAHDRLRCDAQLKAAGLAAHRHNLRFYLVDRTLSPLPAGLTDATAVRLVEPTGTVAQKYNAETDGSRVAGGPVLVFVSADGQVDRVLPKPTASTLERGLSRLVPEAAPAS